MSAAHRCPSIDELRYAMPRCSPATHRSLGDSTATSDSPSTKKPVLGECRTGNGCGLNESKLSRSNTWRQAQHVSSHATCERLHHPTTATTTLGPTLSVSAEQRRTHLLVVDFQEASSETEFAIGARLDFIEYVHTSAGNQAVHFAAFVA